MTRYIIVGSDDVRVAEVDKNSLGEGILDKADYPAWVNLGVTKPGWYTQQGVPVSDDILEDGLEPDERYTLGQGCLAIGSAWILGAALIAAVVWAVWFALDIIFLAGR